MDFVPQSFAPIAKTITFHILGRDFPSCKVFSAKTKMIFRKTSMVSDHYCSPSGERRRAFTQGAGWLGLFEHKKFEEGVFMVVEVPAVAYLGYRCLSQVRKSSVEEKGWCLQL